MTVFAIAGELGVDPAQRDRWLEAARVLMGPAEIAFTRMPLGMRCVPSERVTHYKSQKTWIAFAGAEVRIGEDALEFCLHRRPVHRRGRNPPFGGLCPKHRLAHPDGKAPAPHTSCASARHVEGRAHAAGHVNWRDTSAVSGGCKVK